VDNTYGLRRCSALYTNGVCARAACSSYHTTCRYIILLCMCMIYVCIVCNIMLLRLLCCDDDGWREWGPGSLVSWHRGAIERIRGRARCGNVARPSTIVRRNRSPPPIDGDAAATVHRNPAFDRCVCLTPPRTLTHTSRQRPTPPLRSIRLRRRRWCSPHLFNNNNNNNNNIQLKYYMPPPPPPVSLPVVEPLPVGHRSHKPTRTHNTRYSRHTHARGVPTKPPIPY